MAFELQTVNIQTKNVVGVGEFAVSTKITLEEDKPLKKVLSVKAFADVNSFESIDTDFNAIGKTQINVLYLTENNTLEIVSGWAEWQNTTKAVGESLHAKALVKEVVTDVVNNEISVSILHNMFVEGLTKQALSLAGNLSEDYVADRSVVSVNEAFATGSGKFVLAETLDIPNAQRVLNVDACLKLTNAVSGIDQVTIEGEADVKILYATSEGTAVLNKTLDIRQEIACLGAISDHSAHACVDICSVNATLEVGEKTSLVLAIGANAWVDTYATKEFETITDLYSLNKKVETVVECVNVASHSGNKYFKDTIICNVAVDEYNVDEVVSLVNPAVNVSQYVINNGKIMVDGVLNAMLLYKNNETEEVESALIACPFVSNTETDRSDMINSLDAFINVNSVKIRSGREIEVVADLCVNSLFSEEKYFEYVKQIEEVGGKEGSSSAITIYVTKENESLFSVAKALNVLPDEITNQNEVVDGKFESGRRIFVYSPLNADF